MVESENCWYVGISLKVCKVEDETLLVKLLGIKIDSQLTFNTHLEIMCKKALQKLNALDYVQSFLFGNARC